MPTTTFLKQFSNQEVEVYCSHNPQISGKVTNCKDGLLTLSTKNQTLSIPTHNILSIATKTSML